LENKGLERIKRLNREKHLNLDIERILQEVNLVVRIGLIKSNGHRVKQKENRRYYAKSLWNHEGQEKKEDEKKENEI
jgi:hypothetical protein